MRYAPLALLIAGLVLSELPDQAHAQRGRRGFGDRGGDSGAAPSGRFGRGGPDRGSFGRGGDSGGSPAGFGRGGPPGGFSRGGFSRDSGSGDRGRGGFPGGRGGFDMSQMASRMSSMMDRNGDGEIDESEMARIPQGLRDRMGLGNSRAMSVTDFSARATESFEARMREREQAAGQDPAGGDSRSSRTSSGSAVFKQSPRQKILQSLPEEYKDGDADGDDQIALFEWAAWKRSDMFAFFELDKNADGFLTARELADDGQEDVVAFTRERIQISGQAAGSTRGRGAATTSRVRTAGAPGTGRETGSRERGDVGDRGRSWGGDRSSSERGRSWGGDRGSSDRGSSDRGRSWGGDRGSSERGSSERGRSWGGDRGGTSRGRPQESDRGR